MRLNPTFLSKIETINRHLTLDPMHEPQSSSFMGWQSDSKLDQKQVWLLFQLAPNAIPIAAAVTLSFD